MQVEDHLDGVVADHAFEVVDDGVVEFVGVQPTAVGVAAEELRPGVAVDHSVDVEHRDHPEDKAIEEVVGLYRPGQEERYQPFHHEAGSRLARMLPRQDPNRLLLLFVVPVGHIKQTNLVATQGPP